MANKTALITGGSGGIGLELAKLAAADGYDLILVARGAEALAATAKQLGANYGVAVGTYELDLGLPGAAKKLLDQIGSRPIDLLVNNAGFATHGALVDTKLIDLSSEIGVNVVALTELSRLVAPAMQQRRSGFILNLASTAAFAPGPLMAVYFATKAYVLSFSVALANELAADGVTVTALCPGPTTTGFATRAELKNAGSFGRGQLSAEAVERIGYEGMRRGKVIVVPGFANKVKTWGSRLIPRALAAKFAKGVS